jgi:hypothetical protein
VAEFASNPVKIAGLLTSSVIFIAVAITVHRVFRRYFLPRWIVWTYVLNGIGTAFTVEVANSGYLAATGIPMLLYAQAAAGSALFTAIWPLSWMFVVWYSLVDSRASPWLVAAVVSSPVVGLILGGAIATNWHWWLRERFSSQPH